MTGNPYIAARVSIGTKARFAALASRRGISESTLLKRLVDGALKDIDDANESAPAQVGAPPSCGKISVRLRAEDLVLLQSRAQCRQIPTATYVALLIRSHLRRLAPLPNQELMALKRSVAEIGAIGRNLNVIANCVNLQETVEGPTKDDLLAVLRALTGIRDYTKSIIRINLDSWERGNAKARD